MTRSTPRSRVPAVLATTIFTEMTQLADRHGAVNLAQGFPDFDGPDFVKSAAKDALDRGLAQYAPVAGVAPLRDALAEKYRGHGLDYDVGSEVTVTCGASEAILTQSDPEVNPGRPSAGVGSGRW